MTDTIHLTGMVFYGFHGVSSDEREIGQRFIVNIEANIDLRSAGLSDCLSHTISYTNLYNIAKDVLQGPSKQLLENVAESISGRILEEFDTVESVKVKVMKPEVPIKGSILSHAAVEIFRDRNID